MTKQELIDRIYDSAVNSRNYLEMLCAAYVERLTPEEFADEVRAFTNDEENDEENDE